MNAVALQRSYLYVPAHKPELFAKALAGGADALVLDLEDGVPPGEKEVARRHVAEFLASAAAKPTWVRLNAADSPQFAADVAAAASPHLAGVRLPKAERAEDVRRLGALLAGAGARGVPLAPLVESAVGVAAIGDLAAVDGVAMLALGEADLAADLGVEGEEGLADARARCVLASRLAGLLPPPQSVYTDLADADGLRRSTERGRRLGFFGRSLIHPSQIETVNAVHTPDAAKVEWARSAISAAGEGDAVLGGVYVDAPGVRAARRVLALADRFGAAS